MSRWLSPCCIIGVMLTIFSIPKPFTDESEVHQANSVNSWRRTGARVLLFGDRRIEDAASRLGAGYGGDLPTSSRGTPLLNEAFVAAKRLSDTPLLCYSNADIIFFPDLMDVCRLLPTSDFLMTGRRTNLDVGERATDGDLSVLLERATEDSQIESVWAMDYFVWPTWIGACPLSRLGAQPGTAGWLSRRGADGCR